MENYHLNFVCTNKCCSLQAAIIDKSLFSIFFSITSYIILSQITLKYRDIILRLYFDFFNDSFGRAVEVTDYFPDIKLELLH